MKAQIWSFDYAVSMIIFATSLVVVMFFWAYAGTQAVEQTSQAKMQDAIISISDILVRSSGIPEHWNNNNVVVVGLASEEKILNLSKLVELEKVNYNTFRSTMGIGNFDFYMQINHTNGSSYKIGTKDVTYGLYPSDAASIASMDRYVLLNNQIVKMRTIIWS